MPRRSLPDRPAPATPREGSPDATKRRRWRAALTIAAVLVVAAVMARAIVPNRGDQADAALDAAAPVPATAAATTATDARLALPSAQPTQSADAQPSASGVPAMRAAPDGRAPERLSSESLAWAYQDVACNPDDAARPSGAAPAGNAGQPSTACAPARVLALVDSSAHARKGSVPIAAAFSAQPLAVTMAPHPRLLLDSATLATLRQRATSSNPDWTTLKAQCDSYIGGTVEYPSGNPYPNKPNIGQGYQGSDYVPALLAEGMCYQVLKTSNPTAAASYGAKAVDILVKMSASGSQGQPPCNDSGYGIRFYGVGMGLGYDWVYELLTPAQRTQIYTTANAWITAWEAPNGCAGFEYTHPQSNYYAGYFHAKAAIALATYDENPSAPAQWDDWLNNQFGKRVQPYYALHLAGGGWPEGYGNYAPLGIQNMSMPLREVKTATGQDLVHATAPYLFPLDSADYVMHFTWPSRAYFDDRDTNHANGVVTPPVGTTQVGVFQQILGALAYWGSPKVGVFHQYLNDVNTATSGYNTSDPWLLYLNAESTLPTAAVNTLPLSYLATGMGAVAARSDWSTGASWMSFRAGPYVNNPSQGEESFDQGGLALVRGNTPLLVNTFGWMVHEPNGSSDENLLYDDLYGNFNNTLYKGNRQIYNIYYTRRMSGSSVLDRYGQAAYTTEDNQVSTKVAAYDDHGGYVFVQATGLADMYRAFSTGPAVAIWTRQIVYVRPNRFVVYDRTTSGGAGYDQFLAWHFPANPATGSAPTGESRLDVTYNGTYAGAVTTVLPANATLTTIPLYPTSNPAKIWQVQVRPPDAGTSQRWLTVFDLSASAAAVAVATPVAVSQGNMVGVRMAGSSGNDVVLQSAAAAGAAVTPPVVYTVPAAVTHHVLTELAPATGYNISVASSGGNHTVTVSPGGTYTSSAAGVLDFYVNADGTVQPTPPPTPLAPPPVSDLPVPGFPKPYKP
ncbi:hypothetical protein [Rhodanobacter sp. PCA2]|uniref:hypothetical protein n=1 Tax=Rhodanobacter sp. PCA2 TaxID=2006117 RepID=UPI0021074EEC|nr:hypothetical protein [Rhodanobacter sp. PCA2]